jgi:hypothetical protein
MRPRHGKTRLSAIEKASMMPDAEAAPTQPRIFHIHVDAQQLPADLRRFALDELGFYDSNFSGHPEGFRHFEPRDHLTLKLRSRAAFEATWAKLEAAAERPDFVGYLEGEYIVSDEVLASRPYRDIEVPFQIERRQLTGGNGEEFRQSELHLVFRKEGSDRRLAEKLLRAGLYGAYIPKDDGDHLVLTAQGFVRDIGNLHRVVRDYLEASGGAFRCTLKEERALRYKLSGISAAQLPEIAGRITYLDGLEQLR